MFNVRGLRLTGRSFFAHRAEGRGNRRVFLHNRLEISIFTENIEAKGELMKTSQQDAEFRPRIYRKSELAMLYFPYAGKKQALSNLTRWIRRCDELREALEGSQSMKNRRFFLRPEVELIVKHLGEP